MRHAAEHQSPIQPMALVAALAIVVAACARCEPQRDVANCHAVGRARGLGHAAALRSAFEPNAV
jgi:hypothetical protein